MNKCTTGGRYRLWKVLSLLLLLTLLVRIIFFRGLWNYDSYFFLLQFTISKNAWLCLILMLGKTIASHNPQLLNVSLIFVRQYSISNKVNKNPWLEVNGLNILVFHFPLKSKVRKPGWNNKKRVCPPTQITNLSSGLTLSIIDHLYDHCDWPVRPE